VIPVIGCFPIVLREHPLSEAFGHDLFRRLFQSPIAASPTPLLASSSCVEPVAFAVFDGVGVVVFELGLH